MRRPRLKSAQGLTVPSKGCPDKSFLGYTYDGVISQTHMFLGASAHRVGLFGLVLHSYAALAVTHVSAFYSACTRNPKVHQDCPAKVSNVTGLVAATYAQPLKQGLASVQAMQANAPAEMYGALQKGISQYAAQSVSNMTFVGDTVLSALNNSYPQYAWTVLMYFGSKGMEYDWVNYAGQNSLTGKDPRTFNSVQIEAPSGKQYQGILVTGLCNYNLDTDCPTLVNTSATYGWEWYTGSKGEFYSWDAAQITAPFPKDPRVGPYTEAQERIKLLNPKAGGFHNKWTNPLIPGQQNAIAFSYANEDQSHSLRVFPHYQSQTQQTFQKPFYYETDKDAIEFSGYNYMWAFTVNSTNASKYY